MIKRIARLLGRLGWPGITGLVLLSAALTLYFSAIAPAQTRLATLRQEAAALQAGTLRTRAADRDSPAAQLAVFYRFFPSRGNAPDWLDSLFQAARDQNLAVEEGEYRSVRDKSGKLTRLQVILPLKGSYVQIRKFLAAVLSDIPIASLDSIKFERQKIGDAAIAAKVKLTLYLGQT